MPFNPNSNVFSRVWKFVDHRQESNHITRSDLDIALDDLAQGINFNASFGGTVMGNWSPITGAFPTVRPDGSRIKLRDLWVVDGAGTVGGVSFVDGDYLIALVAGGGGTYDGNWLRISESRLIQLVADSEDAATRAEDAATDAAASAAAAAVFTWGHANYTSRAQFVSAVAAEQFDAEDEGFSVSVDGVRYVKRTGATTIPDLPGWDMVRSRHKSIITGDWQVRLAYPAEITALRGVLDDMQAYHGDADDLLHVGDIVERASEGGTGSTTAVFSHEAVLEEVYSRLTVPRTYFITGNHDSDGFSSGDHEHYWSHRRYTDFIGRKFYAVRMGNLLRIHMGTMSGSPGGEINRLVLSWFDQMVKRHAGCNIEVFLHQPLYGVSGFLEDTKSVQYKATSDLIVETLNAADNIAFVAYGHVLRPEDATNYYDLYGTRLIGFNMHIPRITTLDPDDQPAGPELPYGVLEYSRGATAGTVKFWNAVTHAWITGRDVAVTYKYPLDLGAGVPDYDGRYQAGSVQAMFDGPVTIQRDISEDRENLGTVEAPDWSSVQGMRSMLRLSLTENANDNAKQGDGPAVDFWLPGSTFDTDASGETQLNITDATIGGRMGIVRENGTDNDYTGRFVLQLGDGGGNTGDLRDVLKIDGSTGRGYLPLGGNPSDGLAALGLMASIDFSNSLLDKGPIASGQDLNAYAEPGVYRILDGTTAAGIANVPFTASGAMVIVFATGTPATARPVAAVSQMQIYIARATTDGPRIYTRVCNAGTWAAWRLLQHDGLSRTSIAATPEFRGQKAYVGGVIYEAAGTASTADWKQISN